MTARGRSGRRTPSRRAASSPIPPRSERTARGADPAATADDETVPWPWYRSDPWLAVELSASLPIGVAFLVPQSARVPLVALSLLLVVIGLSMRFRQGSFHGRPRPRRLSRASDAP